MEEREDAHFAPIARNCQSCFKELLVAAMSEKCCTKDFLHPRDVQGMQDRFNQWAGNLGALQPFQSPLSLDHRLRDASLVRKSIFKSLDDLCSSIQAATDIALGKRQNRVAEPSVQDLDIDFSEYDLSSSESDSSSVPSSDGRNALAPTSEMQELMSAIKISLDSLFRTSIFIRKFSSKDKRLRAAGKEIFDNGADKLYLEDRYPLLKGNTTLVRRLSEANARRRQFFKYCRDHSDHLSTPTAKGKSDDAKAQACPVSMKDAPAETIWTAERKSSLLADTEATAFVADEAAQAQMLKLIEEPETVSAVSFATSVAETPDEDWPFPPIPAEAFTDPHFTCPYCCQSPNFKSEGLEYKWKKHVLQDLQPYICTFPSCGLDTFQSQHTWFEHELLVHRCRWVCSECSAIFRSSDNFKGHVARQHRGLISERQLSAFTDQSKRPVDSIQPSECPFCDDVWAEPESSLASSEEVLVVDLDQFRRHLGKHLRKVAQFSLPRPSALDDEDAIPKGLEYCSRGWRIVSKKWTTFRVFSCFRLLYEANYKGLRALVSACYWGDAKLVHQLLDQGADCNARAGFLGNALQRASRKGHEEVVRLLINRGADVNLKAQTKTYSNAIQAAVYGGHERAVQLLLDHGAKIDSEDKQWNHVVSVASEKGYEKVIQLLLNRGVDVNAKVRGEMDSSALHAAAHEGQERVVQLLLDHGADINSQDIEWGSVLESAVSQGHENVVRLLLERGADVKAVREERGTLLNIAAIRGYEKVVQLLLDHGVNINEQRGNWKTALQTASAKGHGKIVQLLLDRGTDVPGGMYGSALQQAAYGGYEQIFELLLSHRADVNAERGVNGHALHAAACAGHQRIVELLLHAGAHVNAQGGEFGSALQAAAYGGYDQILELLLSHGSNVNAQGGRCGNALQAASIKGHEKISQRLLESGADAEPHGVGWAFITVTILNTDHNLLLNLRGSRRSNVYELKLRVCEDIPAVLEVVNHCPPESLSLVFDNRTLGDNWQWCEDEGLRQGSHVFGYFGD